MVRQYGMLIDLNRCTGCNACIIACKQENDLPPRLDAVPGSTGFSYIRVEVVGPEGEYPDLSQYYLPVPCMHCANPACLEICPTEAIYKRADGLVLINESECTGCEECLTACPYDAISMDGERNVARKCTLCAHLIDQGDQPACVRACNAGAIIFGNLADMESEISRDIKEAGDRSYVLKPEMGTEPSVYYVKFGKAISENMEAGATDQAEEMAEE